MLLVTSFMAKSMTTTEIQARWTESGGSDSSSVDNPRFLLDVESAGAVVISSASAQEAVVFVIDNNATETIVESSFDGEKFFLEEEFVLDAGIYTIVVGTKSEGAEGFFTVSAAGADLDYFPDEPVSVQNTFSASNSLGGDAGPVPELVLLPEYVKQKEVNAEVQTLGFSLLGDSIDMSSGSVSIEHTDVSLPGNFPIEVAIRRSKVSQFPFPHKDEVSQATLEALGAPAYQKSYALSDWSLAVPKITKIHAAENPYVDGERITMWSGAANFCMGNSTGPRTLYASDVNFGEQMSMEYWHYSEGMNLNVPGQGSKKLLDKASDSGMSWPENTIKVTKDYWYASCLELGGGVNGLTVTSPQGHKYIFDKFVYRPIVGQPTTVVINSKSLNSIQPRVVSTLLATRVEDALGNWVGYEYDDAGWLERIHSSDGRELKVEYSEDTGLVEKVEVVAGVDSSVGTRAWTYSYKSENGNTYLEKVTLPDGRQWEMDISVSLDANSAHDCEAPNKTWSITHPNGTEGKFTFSEKRHKKTVNPGIIDQTKTATCKKWDGGVDKRVNYYDAMSLVTKSITIQPNEVFNWTYDYSEEAEGDKWTEVVEPSGYSEKHYFYYDAQFEGLPKKIERLDESKNVLEEVNYTYTPEGALGGFGLMNQNANVHTLPRHNFVTTTSRFDIEGVETQYMLVNRYNSDYTDTEYSFGNPVEIEMEQGTNQKSYLVEYFHDVEHWKLGQQKKVSIIDGESPVTLFEMTYSSVTASNEGVSYDIDLPSLEKRYGVWVKELSEYHPDGNVKKVEFNTKARRNASTLSDENVYVELNNYKRGVAQTVSTFERLSDSSKVMFSQVIDANGWVTSQTNGNGVTTNYGYDLAGRIRFIDLPEDSDSGIDWLDSIYVWDDASNKRTLKRCALNSENTDCEGNASFITEEQYDSLLRLKLVNNTDVDNNLTRYKNYKYYKTNLVKFESVWSKSRTENVGTYTNYDALGQTLSVEAPGSGTVTSEYLSDNKIRVTDGRGNETTYSYRAYSTPSFEVVEKIESPENVTTDIEIDIYGNVLSIVQAGLDADGEEESFTEFRAYDTRNRLCKISRNDVGQTVFSYDDMGRVVWQVEGTPTGSPNSCAASVNDENKTLFTYDNRGDVYTTTYQGEESFTRTFTRDNNGNVTALRSGQTTQTYKFNDLDMLVGETLQVPNKSLTLSYGYNSMGHRNSITYPDGDTITLSPNAFGEPTEVKRGIRSQSGGSSTSAFTYAKNVKHYPTGTIDSFEYGNGYQHKTELNDDMLPARINDHIDGSAVLDMSYGYDNNQNVSSITDSVNSLFSYSALVYDGLDRLVSTENANGVTNNSMTYDSFGNITSYATPSQSLTYTYDSNNNRLERVFNTNTGASVREFDYDERGNVVDNGKHSFGFNRANQMISAGSNSSYMYDGHNRRVVKQSQSDVEYSMYNLEGKLLYRESEDGGINYVYLGSRLIAKDGFGLESAGEQHYRPYGESIEGEKNDVGYTGHKFDTDIGLSYMQARYYDPVIGRFYSNDPVGWTPKNPVMSFNRYLYVNNNPYKYTDPNGEFLNFAVKFVADVALGAALNYAETGSLDLGGAVTDAAAGALNPAKTLQKAKRLANVMKGGGKNSPCPLSCFVAGTEVLTKEGHKAIEDISVGDLVWAKNVETGLSEWKPVTHKWIVEDKEIYEIGITTIDGSYQNIEATASHPFYVVGKGWIKTTDLKLGDRMVDNQGVPITVTLLRNTNRKDTAYNFTVADFHTYYVTEQNVLVHNCNKRSGSSKNEAHGDGGRAMTKAEKQIADYESQMEGANKKTRKVLQKKIQRVREDAQKKEKGENHSMKNKG
jgi:RHS repeat-associated protein